MGFFKDLREDISQAVNELLPDDALFGLSEEEMASDDVDTTEVALESTENDNMEGLDVYFDTGENSEVSELGLEDLHAIISGFDEYTEEGKDRVEEASEENDIITALHEMQGIISESDQSKDNMDVETQAGFDGLTSLEDVQENIEATAVEELPNLELDEAAEEPLPNLELEKEAEVAEEPLPNLELEEEAEVAEEPLPNLELEEEAEEAEVAEELLPNLELEEEAEVAEEPLPNLELEEEAEVAEVAEELLPNLELEEEAEVAEEPLPNLELEEEAEVAEEPLPNLELVEEAEVAEEPLPNLELEEEPQEEPLPDLALAEELVEETTPELDSVEEAKGMFELEKVTEELETLEDELAEQTEDGSIVEDGNPNELIEESSLENIEKDGVSDIDEDADDEENSVEKEVNIMENNFENVEAKDETTVITKGTIINGSIISDGSLEVNGTITGDVECVGKLTINGNVSGHLKASEVVVSTPKLDGGIDSMGDVKIGVGTIVIGDVTAKSATISGAVKGEVDVQGPVVVDSTAIVKGNITAKSVQVNNGAIVDGYCKLAYAEVDIDNFFEAE